MHDILPSFSPETLHNATAQELLDLLIEHEDRVTRPLFDACVARGEDMVAALTAFFDMVEALPLEDLDNGQWWAQLHGILILGKLPGEAAGRLLARELVLADRKEDENLMDWVAGNWAPLFANKPASVVERVREIALDRTLDWYTRVQAPDVIINAVLMAGGAELEAALDWVAAQMADPEDDSDYRNLTGNLLLDFPRERNRARLERVAAEQARYGSLNVTFDQDDIARAYSRPGDRPDWLRRPDPWSFYGEDQILERQARWREEDERRAARAAEPPAPVSPPPARTGPVETYVRATAKLGRNDPCHCGSGKKYKKCCMAADAVAAMH
jgi:hypothetical protein